MFEGKVDNALAINENHPAYKPVEAQPRRAKLIRPQTSLLTALKRFLDNIAVIDAQLDDRPPTIGCQTGELGSRINEVSVDWLPPLYFFPASWRVTHSFNTIL